MIMRHRNIRNIFVFSVILLITACTNSSFHSHQEQAKPVHNWSDAQFSTIKSFWIKNLTNAPDSENPLYKNKMAIKLGHRLFFDKRLSLDGKIACANCHEPKKYFTDGLKTSVGVSNAQRNSPTIISVSHNTWFFWDGSADSLWSQALGPLENPVEHGGHRLMFAKLVHHDTNLRQLYENVFGAFPALSHLNFIESTDDHSSNMKINQLWKSLSNKDKNNITTIFVNLGKAIAAYENQIQHGESRFDQYVAAIVNNDARTSNSILNKNEIAGLNLFTSKAKCFICHTGPLLTDQSFHNIGVPAKNKNKFDWGRYNGVKKVKVSPFNCKSDFNSLPEKNCDELKYAITSKEETLGSMKTPGLRNVSKTAPYMHAGQYINLVEVIKHYNDPPALRFRQSDLFNIELNDQEIKNIEAFLLTLDSPIDADVSYLNPPID